MLSGTSYPRTHIHRRKSSSRAEVSPPPKQSIAVTSPDSRPLPSLAICPFDTDDVQPALTDMKVLLQLFRWRNSPLLTLGRVFGIVVSHFYIVRNQPASSSIASLRNKKINCLFLEASPVIIKIIFVWSIPFLTQYLSFLVSFFS